MQLQPMPSAFEADVRIDNVWCRAVEILENFPRRRQAIMSLTGIDVAAGLPIQRAAEMSGRATAVALQDCVERGLISIYVFNPAAGRFHLLPKQALVSSFVGVTRLAGQDTNARAGRTAELSWSSGTLQEIDCDKSLYRLAREKLPLMTSTGDAKAILNAFPHVLDQEAGKPATGPPPDDNPTARRHWIEALCARPRWPVREALLWIALRSLEMADMVLSSLWPEDDPVLGMVGPVWVLGHMQAQAHDRSFVDEQPEQALMKALLNDAIVATGLFEGSGQRSRIEGHLWEELVLAAPQKGQHSGTAARQAAQVHGIAWTDYWSDILIDRVGLLASFPAVGATDGRQVASQVSRCRGWLVDRMRLSPDHREMSKGEFLKRARQMFDVSERSFNVAWSSAIQETGAEAWRRAGRPPRLQKSQRGNPSAE